MTSNLLSNVGGRSICWATDWKGSNLPNFGFAAANTLVSARNVAWTFALLMVIVCCSIASCIALLSWGSIFSNSSIQIKPLLARTIAPASKLHPLKYSSLTTVAVKPAPEVDFPTTYLPFGEISAIKFRVTDLATPGSPISKMCISPLLLCPSAWIFLTPPKSCKTSEFFISSYPQTLGIILFLNLSKISGSFESSRICFSSSSPISSSSKVSSIGIKLFASIASSNLVDKPPVGKGTGTSFKVPIIFILLPGVVFSSIIGSTKSSFTKTLILFGCSPPDNDSGDSSITSLWVSTISLLINLNPPFLPQLHLEGSRNFFSICNTEITVPQLGHSNFAFTTCGLTSLAWRIIPSITTSSFKCLERIFLTFIWWPSGRFINLTFVFSINPNSSIASSIKLNVSSGFESISFESLFENSESFMKSRWIIFCPFLIESPNSFLWELKKFFASITRVSFVLSSAIRSLERVYFYSLLWKRIIQKI